MIDSADDDAASPSLFLLRPGSLDDRRRPSPSACRTWRDWGSDVRVVTADGDALDEAQHLTRFLMGLVERAVSRFRPDSDLSRANAAAGRAQRVDPLLSAVLEVALDAATRTEGLVDPCLGDHLAVLGYDDDLGLVRARSARSTRSRGTPRPQAWRDVVLDGDTVTVPAGSALDLGAVGKAWTADLVACTLTTRLGSSCLVDLGGDLALRPAPGSRDGWSRPLLRAHAASGAAYPRGVEAVVGPEGGGIATSSTLTHRWLLGDLQHHHLIDPRSGLPAAGPWVTVTASARTCVEANVASTAAVVHGHGAPGWLSARGVDARLVDREDRTTCTGRWPRWRASA